MSIRAHTSRFKIFKTLYGRASDMKRVRDTKVAVELGVY